MADSRPIKRRRAIKRSCEACTTCHSYCDRARPICNTCERLGRECVYQSQTPSLPFQSPAFPSPSFPSPASLPSPPSASSPSLFPPLPSPSSSPSSSSSSPSSPSLSTLPTAVSRSLSASLHPSPTLSLAPSSSAFLHPQNQFRGPSTQTDILRSHEEIKALLIESKDPHKFKASVEKLSHQLSSLHNTIHQQSELLKQQQAVIEQQSFMMKAVFNLAFRKIPNSVPSTPRRASNSSNWKKYELAPQLLRLACESRQLFLTTPETATELSFLLQKRMLEEYSSRFGSLVTINAEGICNFSVFTEAFARLLKFPISATDNAIELIAEGKVPLCDPQSAEYVTALLPQLMFNPSEASHVVIYDEAHSNIEDGVPITSSQYSIMIYNQDNRAISCLSFIELHNQMQVPTAPSICFEICRVCQARGQSMASTATAQQNMGSPAITEVFSPLGSSSFDTLCLYSPDIHARSAFHETPPSPAFVRS